MTKWLSPILWPLKAEFGWMFPKSAKDANRERLFNLYYIQPMTVEDRSKLRARIEREYPEFFQSEHLQ